MKRKGKGAGKEIEKEIEEHQHLDEPLVVGGVLLLFPFLSRD